MNIISRFKAPRTNWLYRLHWKWRRRQFRNLCSKRAVAAEFALIKQTCSNFLSYYESNGSVPVPNRGLCFNLGFMGHFREVGNFNNQCGTFLELLWQYNKIVRGRPFNQKLGLFWAHPFADIDQKREIGIVVLWEGESKEVRLHAVRWILMQIEYYELDQP